MENEAINIVKICWLIFCDKYDLLRKLEGCSKLDDLDAVKTDKLEVFKIADGFGIQEEYRYVRENPSLSELKEDAKTIKKMFNKFSGNNEPIFLFVYFGGHGVSHNSKQIALLNSNDAK